MTPAQLVEWVRQHGGTLSTLRGTLKYSIPMAAMSPKVLEDLRMSRRQVMDFLGREEVTLEALRRVGAQIVLITTRVESGELPEQRLHDALQQGEATAKWFQREMHRWPTPQEVRAALAHPVIQKEEAHAA